MLHRAVHSHASGTAGRSSEKEQSPLQLNAAAVNIVREPSHNSLKRKFERTMSSSGGGLSSLHNHTSFKENAVVDLTAPSPPKRTASIQYPSLDGIEVDAATYPTLPPLCDLPSSSPSSAPVAWPSSPESHFVNPRTNTLPQPPIEAEAPQVLPKPPTKRVLPATFTSHPPPTVGQRDKSNGSNKRLATSKPPSSNRFDMFAAPTASGLVKPKAKSNSKMSEMLEKPPLLRHRQNSSMSMSRTSSVQSLQSAVSESDLTKPDSRMADPFLSDEQKAVFQAVIEEKKSVFFTGSAGTGKSVLMKAIIARLRHIYRKDTDRVAITASTGLASCILEGQTLHSWAGIGLGKEPAPELVKKIKRNQKSRQKWLRTKILIIDEISMVDAQLFDKLEQVARTIRSNGRPFGGIQLVVTGDFFQLPPVPDRNSVAKFVFDAMTWNTCIQHTILLTHVFRQKDEKFAQMLNEMRLGKMSPATVREFKSLSRPLNFHDEIEATELYPRREEVENANQNRMRKLSGQVLTFDAVDSGVQDVNVRRNLLANFIAPERLDLKKGAQVMLIKNIDSQLVNGSLGIVQSFMDEGTFSTYKADEDTFLFAQEPDDGSKDAEREAARQKIQAARMKNSGTGTGAAAAWPMVRFNLPDGTSRSMLCLPDEWKTESQQGEILAKRVQVPLILAWALSIHKAQGQTLTRVKVDLGKVFEKGQAYVALSRARSKEGLQVLRFDERKVMVHPKVLDFYSQLAGHETLDVPVTATNRANPATNNNQDIGQLGGDDDDFGDDFSYEEMLEAEAQHLKASVSTR